MNRPKKPIFSIWSSSVLSYISSEDSIKIEDNVGHPDIYIYKTKYWKTKTK